LRWRSWDSDNGQRRSKHEVVAERVQFLPLLRDESVEKPIPPEFRREPEEPDLFQPVSDELSF
jgi:single-stranded DNA-binding protein